MTTQFPIQKVTTKTETLMLYNCSALTWEGLDLDSLGDVIAWMQEYHVNTDKVVFYVIEGGVMNALYELTGSNAYPTNLNIISVTGVDHVKLAIPRFQVGGKWFDDIVDNNRRRQFLDNDYEDDSLQATTFTVFPSGTDYS